MNIDKTLRRPYSCRHIETELIMKTLQEICFTVVENKRFGADQYLGLTDAEKARFDLAVRFQGIVS